MEQNGCHQKQHIWPQLYKRWIVLFIENNNYDFTLYNCQKAKDVWRNKQKREVSRIRVEVGGNCNLNQVGGYKTVNNNKSDREKHNQQERMIK